MLSLPKSQSNPHQVRSKFLQTFPAVLQSSQTNYKQSKCSSSSLVDPITHSFTATQLRLIDCLSEKKQTKPKQNKTYQYIISERTSNLVISLIQRPLLQLLGSLYHCLCLGFIKWMATSPVPREACPILPLVINICSLQSRQRPRNRLNKFSLAYLRIALLLLIQISVTWRSHSGCFAFCTKLPKYWIQAKHHEEKSISTIFFLAYTALYD